MKAKYVCLFCNETNTKLEDIKQGFWGTKVGEKEIIDKNAKTMMRCSNGQCGKVLHQHCLKKLKS